MRGLPIEGDEVKQAALIDTAHLAETDPDARAVDAAYRRMTEQPRVRHEQWGIERVQTDAACMALLNHISQMSDSHIDSIQLIAPDTYVVLWYRYVSTETTR